MDALNKEEQTIQLAALLRGVDQYLEGVASVRGGGDSFDPRIVEHLISDSYNDLVRCVDIDLFAYLLHSDLEDGLFPHASFGGSLSNERTGALNTLLSLAGDLSSQGLVVHASESSLTTSGGKTITPIFDRLELLHSLGLPRRYVHPVALTGTDTEPPIFAFEGQPSSNQVSAHAADFVRQFDILRQGLNWDDFDCVYTHILNLLKIYFWCVPSGEASGTSDVPLYEQLRAASAVTACLYRYQDAHGTWTSESVSAAGQTRCVLMGGGFSGIQNYIFDISTIGAGGVAKRLRARSFFVQLLSEAASLRILWAFRLPLANVLMASGGKFYVLLPNLATTEGALYELQRQFDQWFLREFHGELAINLAWTELADADFAPGGYGSTLARLHGALQRRKSRRLGAVLQGASGWSEEFVLEPFTGESVCLACRRFPAIEFSTDRTPAQGADICKQCASQLRLGRKLTTAQYLSFYEGDGGEFPCLGLSATLGNKPRPKASLVVRLNNPDLSAALGIPATFRYLANHVPREENGDPRQFDQIAGGGSLGVLKADVDNLGLIFQEGFRRDPPASGLDTISRLATLNRQLDWFFSGWLEWLMSARYPDCYTVYSGGDDLLVVGPRARTLHLAREIQESFSRYVGHPELTLSVGVAVVKPKQPLAHTAHQANGALQRAKDAGRDRLSIWGETLTWEEVGPVWDEITDLSNCAAQSSFLYHLLRCADLWRRYHQDGDLIGLRYHSQLAYELGRNINYRQQPTLHAWATRLLQFPPPVDIRRVLNHLRLIARWVLLERRK